MKPFTFTQAREWLVSKENLLEVLEAYEKQALAFGLKFPFAIFPAMAMAMLAVFIAETLSWQFGGKPIKASTARGFFVFFSVVFYIILAHPEIYA